MVLLVTIILFKDDYPGGQAFGQYLMTRIECVFMCAIGMVIVLNTWRASLLVTEE